MDHWVSLLVSAALTLLIGGFFVHAAAKLVIDRSSFGQAILAFLLGTLLATGVMALAGDPLGRPIATLLGLIAMAFAFAAVYRTKWSKGAIIGVVAWIIWAAVTALVNWFWPY